MVDQNKQTSAADLPKTLIGRLFYFAAVTPSQEAIVADNLVLSYSQLAYAVAQQAQMLAENGISSQSLLGIQCADDIGHLLLTLAASYLGATSCTVPSYEAPHMQETIKAQCGVTAVLDHHVLIDLAAIHPDNHKPEWATRSGLLFSTSGSTGKPKLVMYDDADLVAQAHRHINSREERFTCRATMEHNFAKRHRLYCLAMGASNIFLRGHLDTVVTDCQQLKVNVMHVSSFQAQELLQLPDRHQLSTIRLKLGGSHIPLALREQLRTTITSQLQAGYGTTETGAIAFTDPDDDQAGESVGQALPGIKVAVVDKDRQTLPLGEKGELAIQGEGLFRGYLGQEALTAQRLDKGWFYTGDIGYIDDQQRIHLSGRLDDMFTFNSMNIYPQEIETEIRQYPDVVDAVVLAKTSTIHGQIPVALVVFNKDAKPDVEALSHFVQQRVGLRSPRHYTIVDAIPTNASGKVSRVEAAKLTEESDMLRQQMIDLIDEQYKRLIKPAHLADFIAGKSDLSLNNFGMDSLARMGLLVALETRYDIIISPQELARLRTVGKLASRALALSKASQNDKVAPNVYFEPLSIGDKQADTPYIVRFFQRLYRYCSTVALLNQTFARLEHRLSPQEVVLLAQYHQRHQLISEEADAKFYRAITDWLNETQALMLQSGRTGLASFCARRVAKGMTLFSSNDTIGDKTLLLVFPPRGVRHLMMPNAVLLQHIDEQQYDVLMITDVDYRFGRFPFGQKLRELASWIQQQTWYEAYSRVRTCGVSAGSFPAIAIGYLLQADISLSIAGRFHKKKHPLINIDKYMTTRYIRRHGQCGKLILSYSINNKRDSRFARFFNQKCQGKEVAVAVKSEKLPHLMLRRLAERGELAAFLATTLLAQADEPILDHYQQRHVMHFPLSSS